MNRVLQTVMRSTKNSVVLNQKLVNTAKLGLLRPRTIVANTSAKKPCCKSCAGGGHCESEKNHHH